MEFMLADVGIAMGHFSGTELKFDFLLSSDLLHFVASLCTRSPDNVLTNIHLKLDYAGQDWDKPCANAPWINSWLRTVVSVSFGPHFFILHAPFCVQVSRVVPLS
ncbi:hypothetical protein ACFX19_009657 [Malus domestica]